MSNETCVWEQAEWDGDYYSTSCGRDFYMIEGMPSDNGFRFCVWCGQPIATLLCAPEPDDDEDGES